MRINIFTGVLKRDLYQKIIQKRSFEHFSNHQLVLWYFSNHLLLLLYGSLAEWSKALVLGTSPKGRGFESHSCQIFSYFFVEKHQKPNNYFELCIKKAKEKKSWSLFTDVNKIEAYLPNFVLFDFFSWE